MRRDECPMSAKMLQLKALEVAEDKGIPTNVFSASYSRRRRFMRRHKISIRTQARQFPRMHRKLSQSFFVLLELSSTEHRKRIQRRPDKFFALPLEERRLCGSSVAAKTKTPHSNASCSLSCNKQAPFLLFKAGVYRHKIIQTLNDSKRHGFGVRLWKDISRLQRDHRCQIYGNPTA
ncbi:LOW QUALITY PROTEIN: hypothetical protein PHMEG_00026262 [Phytophthora megakarya]|uniref:HTH CENPB-type domain-containing protein n=1 Tax=Phytophthora megakarya TaxID=4795 RepID=A0A225VAT4_9STRA|nr:LOW QUALITY PROTEIN: hypothetical protein PHMEG_00026262 [Phytophthora megakarya]